MDSGKRYCLFITHSYPSINSPNSLCVEKIINNRPINICPIVLCYRFNGQKKYEEIDGIKIYRVKKDWAWPVEGCARSPQKSNFANRFLSKIITRLRQTIYIPFYPVYDIAAVNTVKKAAIKIVNSNKTMAIFADFNGFDTLIGGCKCSKSTHIPFYPIFWDYLFDGFPSKYVTKKFNDKRKLKIERNIIVSSRRTIMLDTAESKVRSRYLDEKLVNEKLVFIGVPFFDADNSNWISRKTSTYSFLYGGTAKDRNFEPLLRALSLLNIPLQFDLYSDASNDKAILLLQKKYPFLKAHKPVSPNNLIEKCKETDFLVNFGVSNPNAISSKIFLYFSICKPVITTFRIHDEPCLRFVNNYPLGFSFDENAPDLTLLKDFIANNKGKKVPFGKASAMLKKNNPTYFWHCLDLH